MDLYIQSAHNLQPRACLHHPLCLHKNICQHPHTPHHLQLLQPLQTSQPTHKTHRQTGDLLFMKLAALAMVEIVVVVGFGIQDVHNGCRIEEPVIVS